METLATLEAGRLLPSAWGRPGGELDLGLGWPRGPPPVFQEQEEEVLERPIDHDC